MRKKRDQYYFTAAGSDDREKKVKARRGLAADAQGLYRDGEYVGLVEPDGDRYYATQALHGGWLVGFIGGGVVALVGLVLLFVDRRRAAGRARTPSPA